MIDHVNMVLLTPIKENQAFRSRKHHSANKKLTDKSEELISVLFFMKINILNNKANAAVGI